MILKQAMKTLTAAALGLSVLAGGMITAAQAADITLRATANSNENDEDYDGLIVFKNYVEKPPRTVPSKSSCSSARSCARTARNACRASPTARSTSTSPRPAAHRASSPTCRCWTCPI
jgi:hypothetical protein